MSEHKPSVASNTNKSSNHYRIKHVSFKRAFRDYIKSIHHDSSNKNLSGGNIC